jgi:phospholipid/cholesterol/gamma-HCH transport system substrate-binding protein
MALGREFKVGAFVLAGFSVMALVIFLIGEERHVFGSKESFYTVFNDVQGLRRGSPVRMGGVDIGTVSEVAYGEDAKDARIFVHMSIVAAEARRIYTDSVASIEGKGLLGDKMIVLTVGSKGRRLPVGGEIRSKPPEDFTQMLNKLSAVADEAQRVMVNLERATDSFADKNLHDDLKSSLGSLSHILNSVDKREGYVGRLFSDPAEADRISRVVTSLERTSGELEQASRTANQVLSRVTNGPGLAHQLIYSDDGSKTVAQIGQAAEELGVTLKGVREGNGLARGLLFGGTDQKFSSDLNDMSGDLRQIVSDLKAGRGTLGALLVDPSVYEDLKLVLGNVERNKALRALVRYSIRKDEGTPKVSDPDPGTAREKSPRPPPSSGAAIGGTIGGGTRAASGGSD